MDSVSTPTTLAQIASEHGFNALLVLVLLVGIWKLTERHERRMAEKDAEHREERKQFLDALRSIGEAVRDLKDELPRLRRGG